MIFLSVLPVIAAFQCYRLLLCYLRIARQRQRLDIRHDGRLLSMFQEVWEPAIVAPGLANRLQGQKKPSARVTRVAELRCKHFDKKKETCQFQGNPIVLG